MTAGPESETAKIRVVIVDDHVVVRSGLEQFLATTDDIEMVGTAANGVEALERVAELHPDVVLMDLSMPEMNGIDATREIATLYPSSRVLVLTSFSDQTRILDALEAGADGYLLKHADPDDIAEGIRAVFTRRIAARPQGGEIVARVTASRACSPAAHRPRARGAPARSRRFGQQADRPPARHRGTNGEGSPHQRVPTPGRDRPHAGRVVGQRAPDGGVRRSVVVGLRRGVVRLGRGVVRLEVIVVGIVVSRPGVVGATTGS